MAKLAYLDCPTGISGDMCLGALVDAGVPLDYLTEQLEGLGISQEYRLQVEAVRHNAQQATKMRVDLLNIPESHHHHRHLPEIEGLIENAKLPESVRDGSLAIFRALAEAEASVHGIPPEKVHFHEVGATDAIVDIVGTCLGMDWLGIDRLYCSPLPVGGGTIRSAHGLLTVPVPAVLKLWASRQVPIYSNGIERELVTPTGAAIAIVLAWEFGSPPPMRLHKVGQGAGSLSLPIPNILRLWIGEDHWQMAGGNGGVENNSSNLRPSIPLTHFHGHSHDRQPPQSTIAGETNAAHPLETQTSEEISSTWNSHRDPQTHPETVAVLATQIDDCNPQAIGYLFEILFQVGALDVFTQAVGMKKCRPGILLTAICPPEKVEACEAAIFRETTTLGIRRSLQQRSILSRQIEAISTPYGEVRVKVARDRTNTLLNVQPEYEDCAQLARQHQIGWQEMYRSALHSWYERR